MKQRLAANSRGLNGSYGKSLETHGLPGISMEKLDIENPMENL